MRGCTVFADFTRKAVVAVCFLASAGAQAQQSSSYTLRESLFNAGGNPTGGVHASSASYHLTIDALGEGLLGPAPGSASFRVDGGFARTYRPPSEVMGLSFAGKTTLTWTADPAAGAYELYRGLVSTLPGPYGSCIHNAIAGLSASDLASPPGGASYFYLVTVRNRLREEGTKGHRSSGAERPNPAPCP
jgi:hypothetical protein